MFAYYIYSLGLLCYINPSSMASSVGYNFIIMMYLSDSKRSSSVSPRPMLRNLARSRKLTTIQESESIKLLPRVPLSNIRYQSPIFKIVEQQLLNSKTERLDRPSKDFYFPKEKLYKSNKACEINIREGDYYLSSPKGTISPYRISKIERTKISLPAIQNIERISYFTEFIKTLDNRKSSTLGRLSKLVKNNEAPSQTSSMGDPVSLEAKAEVFSFLQACKVGNLKKVTRLVSQNSNLIHASDSILMTGLHWAALRDQPHVVEYLISRKADVNAVDIVRVM
jgi:hypothetical protein